MTDRVCPSCGTECPIVPATRYWICMNPGCLTAVRMQNPPSDHGAFPTTPEDVEAMISALGPEQTSRIGEAMLDSDPVSWMGWYVIGRSAAFSNVPETSLCWTRAVELMDREYPYVDSLVSIISDILVGSYLGAIAAGKDPGGINVASVQTAMVIKFGEPGNGIMPEVYRRMTSAMDSMTPRRRFGTFLMALAEYLNCFESIPDIREQGRLTTMFLEDARGVMVKESRFSLLVGGRRYNRMLTETLEAVQELNSTILGILSEISQAEVDRLTDTWSKRIPCVFGTHPVIILNNRMQAMVKTLSKSHPDEIETCMESFQRELSLYRDMYLNPASQPEYRSDVIRDDGYRH